MSNTRDLAFFGAWNGNNWLDPLANPPTGLIPAGGGNDLVVNANMGGVMTGDVSAASIVVTTPYIGVDTFGAGTLTTAVFQLSPNLSGTSDQLTLNGADLSATDTLIIGQSTTLEILGGANLTGPTGPTPGMQDFGDIEVDGGTITSDVLNVYTTLNLTIGSGSFSTLDVGSYTGLGGIGGTGVMNIAAGGSVLVSGPVRSWWRRRPAAEPLPSTAAR